VGVSCRVEADDELTVLVDAGRLRQVVDNLLHNAVRFAPSGSEIVVRAAARGQDVLLDVTDSGPGFPVEFLPHAFERFSRPDSARAGGGAGLGLSIVQAIAVAHGGRASLRNERQGGATITLELPGRVIAS
jgi:signal transduction histidine kinase